MRTPQIRRLLSSAVALIAVGLAWFYLAPSSLGGSTTYVVTHGISMEPRFHTGDLAVVRSQSNYHVGEIVAYHNHMLGTVVLHRIVGREGSRYLFKGDNNNFVDFEHPTRSQLIGSLWLHIPGAGATLESIRSPALAGALVALGVLLFTGAAFTRRRRGRRRRRAEQDIGRAPAWQPAPARPAVGVLAFAAVALLPFALLALLAFTRAPTERMPVKIPYKQQGTLSYSADATPGPTYAGNRAVTGDPLFTRVVDAVDLSFAYQFTAAAKHSLAGKAWLSATMTASDGWTTTFPLTPTSFFHGDRALVSATLDLSSLLALVHRVQLETGVNSSYTLTLAPHVSASGTIGPTPLSATFAPKMQFSISQLEVQPMSTRGEGLVGAKPSSPSQFTPSASGSVTGTRSQPQLLSLGLARMSVASARTVALSAIAIIIGALLAALALLRPILALVRPQREEAASILARYGRMIVPVARVSKLPGVPVIDVAGIDALVRIAEHYDRSILHERGGGADSFWVADESGQFRYSVGAPAPLAAAEEAPPRARFAAGANERAAAAEQSAGCEPVTAVMQTSPPAPAAAPEPVAAPMPVAAPEPVTAPMQVVALAPAASDAPTRVSASEPATGTNGSPAWVAFGDAAAERAAAYMADELRADEVELGAVLGS